MDVLSILKELSINTAVSGNEHTMSEYIKSMFEKYCDEAAVDSFYNILGVKKGLGNSNSKIMVSAHYDEIGFIVTGFEEGGFLRFSNIGGIDAKILLAQEVTIHGRKPLYGIIGAKPPHLLNAEETRKAVKIDELVIDTGLDAEELKKIVSIGDFITLKALPFSLKGNRLSSKSLDNRAGLCALALLLEELSELKHDADVYVLASTQEEVGLRGIQVAAYKLEPDLAIVIDACHGEISDSPKGEAYPLGKGPAIGIGPNLHRKLTNKIIDIAKEENIPYQTNIEPEDTGTEAWATQVSRAGIPTILLSIPLRYMHTTVETLDISDVKNIARLAARFISKGCREVGDLWCY
ncbi:MAG: M20/M25/M40 family metallo-hydrolase [Clostridia bacterium]|nr:M20/M25/M40 family metallo-hydrolase [Clostridia bacterium]